MFGFNILAMENYASYEGFTNPNKKEKFTVDELEQIMNMDEDITTSNNTNNNNNTSNNSRYNLIKPTTDIDMILNEAVNMATESEEMITSEDMPTDNNEMITSEDMPLENNEMITSEDEEIESEDMINTRNENMITSEDEDIESEDMIDTRDEEPIQEGFNGSMIVENEKMRRMMNALLFVLITYLLIKGYRMFDNKGLNVVYSHVSFLKVSKLNLDVDLVVAVILGLLFYIISRRSVFN